MREKFKTFKKSPSFSGFVLCMAAMIVYIVVQFLYRPDRFFSAGTFNNFAALFKSFTPLILLTIAQAILMFLGIIDISIGIQMSFANVLAVQLPELIGVPVAVAWLLALVATVILATFNGVIVSKLRIPPLLAGFSMIYIVKGINLMISPKPGGNVPMIANTIYSYMIFDVIPVSLLIITAFFFAWKYITKTKFGKEIFAVGGNERNAFITGIDSTKIKIKAYMLSGFVTGVAGLCYTAAYTTGNPITGEIYGLQTISACILGGISLAGGWGTMSCALFGISFQILIQNSVPKIFSMITRINGITYNTYYHNLLSDTIILVGLVLTILLISNNRINFKKVLKKQITGGKDKNAQ